MFLKSTNIRGSGPYSNVLRERQQPKASRTTVQGIDSKPPKTLGFFKNQTPSDQGTESYGSLNDPNNCRNAKTTELPQVAA